MGRKSGVGGRAGCSKECLYSKPATPGYEHAPCIMLQAHMDMVCEKSPEIEHDFDSDSISWQIEPIEAALEKGDVEAAKDIARNTRGPVASIYYQGLMRIDQGIDVVEKSVVSYGGVQAGYLEKGCSWITLFIAMAPSLGFLGTVIGMVQAFDKIQQVGDISPTVVAGGMKVALITTIFGLIVALILQVFYNYVLAKIEALTSEMEDSSISLLDMVIKYDLKYKK